MNFGEATLLTIDQANTMMEAAEKDANDKGWGMSIRITDHNHITLLASWVNNASPMVVNITNMKTKSVTATKLSSAEYGAKLAAGEIEAVEGGVNFGGGLPIFIDGNFVGAIAASGGTPEEDAEVSMAGIQAIGASASM
jgi:glc operon protein GlcG